MVQTDGFQRTMSTNPCAHGCETRSSSMHDGRPCIKDIGEPRLSSNPGSNRNAMDVGCGLEHAPIPFIPSLSVEVRREHDGANWQHIHFLHLPMSPPLLRKNIARSFSYTWVRGSAVARTCINANPKRLRPRHRFGLFVLASSSARPIPQILSTGLASTRMHDPD